VNSQLEGSKYQGKVERGGGAAPGLSVGVAIRKETNEILLARIEYQSGRAKWGGVLSKNSRGYKSWTTPLRAWSK